MYILEGNIGAGKSTFLHLVKQQLPDISIALEPMDNWQKHVADKCAAFVGSEFKYSEHEVTISLNQREAYVVMKALEDQQRLLNPVLVVDPDGTIRKLDEPERT